MALKQSAESSQVRSPKTGRLSYQANGKSVQADELNGKFESYQTEEYALAFNEPEESEVTKKRVADLADLYKDWITTGNEKGSAAPNEERTVLGKFLRQQLKAELQAAADQRTDKLHELQDEFAENDTKGTPAGTIRRGTNKYKRRYAAAVPEAELAATPDRENHDGNEGPHSGMAAVIRQKNQNNRIV